MPKQKPTIGCSFFFSSDCFLAPWDYWEPTRPSQPCTFMSCIVKENEGGVSGISDGASSQSKHRYLLSYMHLEEEQFGITILQHFFSTSHWKGVVGGMRGGDSEAGSMEACLKWEGHRQDYEGICLKFPSSEPPCKLSLLCRANWLRRKRS